MNIKRLEIWLAALDPTVGSEIQKTRPVLVVSNNQNNKFNAIVSVLPITSNTTFVADFEVFIPKGVANLPKDSKAKADQIRTLDKQRLVKKIGKLPASFSPEIKKAIQLHLDLE
jgi:mRNA interferase MazF